ncbi:MAG: hypothetical protein ACKPKO_37615, partial [Candidatus Fonsibacter sp.]
TQICVSIPHWGKKANRMLFLSDIREIEFAAVSYLGPHQGKYDIENERAIVWDDIATVEDEGGRALEPHRRVPPTAGWWPVCAITWKTKRMDHGFNDWGPTWLPCLVAHCAYTFFVGTSCMMAPWSSRRGQSS